MSASMPPSGRRLTMEESRRVVRRVDEFREAERDLKAFLREWRKRYAVTPLEAAAFFSASAVALLTMEVYYERADEEEVGES